jgi:Tfp pilus tip-associated adhesin PilY1
MTTYTLSFGVTGTIDLADMDGDGQPDIPSYDEDPCFANTSTPIPTWPNPTAGNPQKIDDLWHAAVNGRGKFFSASNPQELIGSMTEIMNDISDPASGASVSVNGEELGADTVLFQARYVSGSWVGEVLAFPIDQITGAVLNGPDDILWNSSDKLERDAVTWDNRRIVTYNGADAGIKFRYADLTTAQQDALKESDWGLGLTPDEQADYTLQYIRGRSDNIESLNFRYRTRLLGDIVHCAPVLVGGAVPATADSIDNDDDGFIDESGEREGGTIFAGGNDGMLHAFNAQNGWERFAYVPNLVFENLTHLKETSFTHRFFVDLTPYAKEVWHSDTVRKTYLVGGLGKGGKGYYALLLRHRDDSDSDGYWTDVWNVDTIGDGTSEDTVKNMVLWEYPRADTENDGMDNDGDGSTDEASEIDPDIGYSFSQAYIVKTNSATHRWVVIFGNGYSSVSGNAVLYILDLNGVLIGKIDTGVGGDNGLSTPALVDVNNDQKLDYVYAGDLKGNMWKFDFSDEDYANWGVAFNDGTNPKPLFESGQPITSKPDVMRHCTQYGYMVVFATGRFLHNDDRSDVSQQTIYGIWDYGDNDDDREYLGSFDRGTGELSNQPDDVTLLEQTIIDVRTISGHDYRTFSANAITWNTVEDEDDDQKPNPRESHIGWYVDFPNASPYEGERVFKAVQIRDAKAFVISFIPDISPCSGGGNSFLYIINACNGGRMAQAQFDLGNSDDMVLITDPDDPDGPPIPVPPTGKAYVGILHEPKIIRRPETGYERLYMSASTGVVEEEDVPAEVRGLIYWLER